MIDIALLRSNAASVADKLRERMHNPKKVIDDILAADTEWRNAKHALDALNEQRKTIQGASKRATELKKEHARLEKLERQLRTGTKSLLMSLPNIPDEQAPKGFDSSHNIILKEIGAHPTLKRPHEYISLAQRAGWLNTEAGVRASGARFSYLTDFAARLSFALLSFGITLLQKKGFTLVVPPTIIKKDTMQKMGYLNQAGEQEVFQIKNNVSAEELVLIGTAEQALGGMFIKQVFTKKELPRRVMAYTPCYRREAGSHGKDTKGMFRQHQFEKLEMFSVTTAENSQHEHAFLLSVQEELMQKLQLPYRVVDLAVGDLGYPSARTFDIETWLPGQRNGKGEYRETHSTSNCTEYQSRRLSIRYKSKTGKTLYAHTLNATAFAMQRMIIAIIENNQQPDETIVIPSVLKPYM